MDEESKQDEVVEEFRQELDLLLDKWRQNIDLPTSSLIQVLMSELKIDACFYHTCFLHMIGDLTDILTHDLRKMHEEIQSFREQNKSCISEEKKE